MQGLMQAQPLMISSLLEHARRYHPDTEIVSKTCEQTIVRSNYRTLSHRAKQMAQSLIAMGVKPGDRVATLAWNTHRHLELYFAVSGIGAVLHTVNPRLFPEQIEYILNHAESGVLFFDITFAGLVGDLTPALPHVRRFIAMTDADHMAGMPAQAEPYEDLIAQQDGNYQWPLFDENAASSLCYTSGTTGNPKGVLYSHRSTYLHSLLVCQVDGLQLSSADSTLLAVPLFHVNAWGVPYASALCGAKLVLPGPHLDGKNLYELAVEEKCTFSLGVPTVWMGFFKHLETDPSADPSRLSLQSGCHRWRRGAPHHHREVPRHRRLRHPGLGHERDQPCRHHRQSLPKHRDLPVDKQVDIQVLQGRAMCGVELRVVGEDGSEIPAGSGQSGDLQVRGPWVTAGYFRGEGGDVLDRGLVFDRRRRPARHRWLRPDHRPLQGRDQVRRRMDQLDRSRECRHGASRNRGGRGHLAPASKRGRSGPC
jgi:acyl-CoA synthetase (AMP-forming)/AMP-acid ligase II